MTIDPVELERLAQVARIKHSNELANTPFGVMPSREFEQIASVLTDIADKLRTGQLVPAMPSGDVVEAVKAAIRTHFANDMQAGIVATAAITAYEAVSGVAKMREALRAFHDGALSRSETIAKIDAALGEKP